MLEKVCVLEELEEYSSRFVDLHSPTKNLSDQAMIDYRRFKLNVDVTTEEHISRNLIPIITVTVILL